MRIACLAIAAIVIASGQAVAQEPSKSGGGASPGEGLDLTAEIAGAQIADLTGVELGLGARYGVGGLRLTGMVGGFLHPNQDDRYRSETFANGNTVCRDTTNGQFADDANCAAEVAAYGKLEASWLFDGGLEVGAGARFSEDQTSPYGTLGYVWPNGVAAYAAGGEDYVGLGLALRR